MAAAEKEVPSGFFVVVKGHSLAGPLATSQHMKRTQPGSSWWWLLAVCGGIAHMCNPVKASIKWYQHLDFHLIHRGVSLHE